jgi:hypothetical protein
LTERSAERACELDLDNAEFVVERLDGKVTRER